MLEIHSKKVTDFYNKNTFLDINNINEVFVDILQKLIDNLNKSTESNEVHEMLRSVIKNIGSVQETINKNTEKEMNAISEIKEKIDLFLSNITEKLSNIIHNQRDTLITNMRDLLKSNHADSEKSILKAIKENNEAFNMQINSALNDNDLKILLLDEFKTINGNINSEISKLENIFKLNSNEEIFTKLSSIFHGKYNELDEKIKLRVESILMSSTANSESKYRELIEKLDKQSILVSFAEQQIKTNNNANIKGKIGENRLEPILSDIFPSASIINTAGKTACGDFIIERIDKEKTLIDTKDYETVVPNKEVDKLIRDCEKNNCNGILLSHHSGIAQCENFEIRRHNNKLIVFIHNCNYEAQKIKLAFDIIDHIEPFIQITETNDETISMDALKNFNKELQELVTSRCNLIELIKKNYNDTINAVNKIDLPVLSKFLGNKFANTGKLSYECDICKVYIGKNNRSLAAHKRKCIKIAKEAKIDENIMINTPVINKITE
jgi:hypothetical protein